VLQCGAVCCGVLQCVAVCNQDAELRCRDYGLPLHVLRCSVLQCGTVCCSVVQCMAVWCSVLRCVAVCCSVLQCVAVFNQHAKLIAGTPPPVFPFYLEGSLTKNPEEEDPPQRICTRCFEGVPLPQVSWLGNLPNRKPPRGGGFLRSDLRSRDHGSPLYI